MRMSKPQYSVLSICLNSQWPCILRIEQECQRDYLLASQDDLKNLGTNGLLASMSQIQAQCLGSCERFINCYIAMPVQMPVQCSRMKNLTVVNEPGVHLGSNCLISTWTSDLSNLWNYSIANRVDLGCVFPMGPSPAHRELQPL